MKCVIKLIVIAGVFLFPSAVCAQPFDVLEDLVGDDNVPFAVASSTSTTTTTVAGGVLLTVLIRSAVRKASLHRFLEENRASVQQALVLDADGTGRDLMAFYSPLFPELDEDTWRRCLRQERQKLRPLLSSGGFLPAESAQAFDKIILDALANMG